MRFVKELEGALASRGINVNELDASQMDELALQLADAIKSNERLGSTICCQNEINMSVLSVNTIVTELNIEPLDLYHSIPMSQM